LNHTINTHVFAYFLGNGENGLRLATSDDGYAWTDLEDRFYLKPASGLMRDPFLTRGPDNKYHLIWTTAWESQDIGYAVSDDLINWSSPRLLPVMSTIPGTRNCWAPEMIYDPNQQNFLIFWSSTVTGYLADEAGSSEDDYNHRIWACRTDDFKTFTAPSLYYDPGFNIIDATLFPDPQGGYRMIVKDERLNPPQKNLYTCHTHSLDAPFSAPSQPFTKPWVEGPSVLTLGEWTHVYYDVYKEKRYEGKRTKDFIHWEDISDSLRFPPGARHGSAIRAL